MKRCTERTLEHLATPLLILKGRRRGCRRTLINFRSLWLRCNKNAGIWSPESYLITPFDTGGADDHRSRQLGSRL